MSLSKNQIVIIAVAMLLLGIFVGLFFIGGKEKKIALTAWGVEPDEYFDNAIKAYEAKYPNIKVEYKQMERENYEGDLLNALATGAGPDITMFHRSWLLRQGDKLAPATADIITPRQVAEVFPDVISKDFIFNNKVYALPLYIDTLALYYNKDIFNNGGVLFPAKTWDDFKIQVANLTEFNLSKQLTQSGAALGGSIRSIYNAPDILTLLLLQFSDPAVKKRSQDAYLQGSARRGMEFYMDFSDPTSRYFTWTNSGDDSLGQFSNGLVAMIFDYSDKIKAIKSANPYLNFAVAPMPQYDNSQKANYADYWGLGVLAQSANQAAAWQFIKEMTANPQISFEYLKSSGHPPALKELILQYKDDPVMSVFANQTITADSVYQYDISKFRAIMSETIEAILSGRLDPSSGLSEAGYRIRELSK